MALKIKSADGVRGLLLYNGVDNYYFRVYEPDGSFTDYDLLHSDISVTIDDPDAFFYETTVDGETYLHLDHSPSTLGIEE